MENFLKDFGLLAIFFIIAYGYKKIKDYYDLKWSGLHENGKVYLAAGKFARGAPDEGVRAALENCPEFKEQDVEKILSRAIPHRTDKDGGYRAFLRSVNRAVGEELYDEHRRPPTEPDSMDTSLANTVDNRFHHSRAAGRRK